MPDLQFEEEEFTTQFSGRTMRRILAQAKPHWRWLIGFMVAISLVAFLDSYFTFIRKGIVDQAIMARDKAALPPIMVTYGLLILVQAVGVFGLIYLASTLGERIQYDLRRKMFGHLQDLSFSYFSRILRGRC